jgi:2-phosphosulfolactate phosphatase
VRVVELYGREAAAGARGHVVVIDVLRAFTCAAYAFAGGARSITLVATREEALALREKRRDLVLIGETGGKRMEGFDLGNSPAEMTRFDFAGRDVVQRTGSGTNAAARCGAADAIVVASLVVASATARYLRASGAELVSVLAPGGTGLDGPEDVACRTVIAALLRGDAPDWDAAVSVVRGCAAADQIRDPTLGVGCPEDIDLAVACDRFDFAMPVTREDGLLVARAVPA